jgi:transcriptional regulator with PAS, ATPase and Fis domain
MTMPWKGNIRELDNVIEHAMIVGSSDWIATDDLPARVAEQAGNDTATPGDDLKGAMRVYERNHILNSLERADGDKRKAADALGISLSSLYRKIDELGIEE